jgi:hypothetical protein
MAGYFPCLRGINGKFVLIFRFFDTNSKIYTANYRLWNGLSSGYLENTNGLMNNLQVRFRIGGGNVDFGYSAMVKLHDTADSFKNTVYMNFNRTF